MASYFRDIEYHIIKKIRKADHRLLVAVAWFTNQNIGEEILERKGVDVEIIVDDNSQNRASTALNKLISNGVDVSFIEDLNKKYYTVSAPINRTV